MSDYKESIQLKAEELAEERFGKDFYELSNEEQYRVYSEAMEDVNEGYASRGDSLRDMESER